MKKNKPGNLNKFAVSIVKVKFLDHCVALTDLVLHRLCHNLL